MLTMAAKLRKWRNLSTRIDLMLRSDATPSEERETANQRRGGGVSEQRAFYTWTDSRGVLWRDVLRENARKEFEAARFETDPEVITRLLIGGSDAVSSALDRLAEKQREMIEKRNRDDQP
ncbi:BnaAnng21360D [Brassica napus]|uniref:BnaAnng21360D protein n=1 Tax=Brassica napus TaxID=3708 RepID=A0A078JJK0_BRANA|nr:BnaAnng21360D [Brassica napus]